MVTSLKNNWFSNIRGDVLAGIVVALAQNLSTIFTRIMNVVQVELKEEDKIYKWRSV